MVAKKAMMNDPDMVKLLERYRSLYMNQFGIEEKQLDKMIRATDIRLMHNFLSKWGVDDAIGIVEQSFKPPTSGRYDGQPIGSRLFFNEKWAWFQNKMYQQFLSSRENLNYFEIGGH